MTLNDQLSVLAHRDRRQLLLDLADGPPDSRDGMETNGGSQSQSIAMHHVHLPRLEDHGFITWNQETGEITKGPQFGEIEPLLRTLSEEFSGGSPPYEFYSRNCHVGGSLVRSSEWLGPSRSPYHVVVCASPV
jgi:hypothetical protein